MSRPKKVKEVEEALALLAEGKATAEESSGFADGKLASERSIESRVPVSAGQEVELVCTDVAFGGLGVGRVENFVVFVPYVIDGERVRVVIEKVKKQYALARLQTVLEPSPYRVIPRCPYFGRCGGCQYQHIAYEHQLEIKQKQVQDLMQRLARIDPACIRPIIPCPQPYHYRNRIMVRSQWNRREQRLVIGFLEANSRFVVDIEACAIAQPELNEQLQQIRQHPPRSGMKVVLRVPPSDWVVPKDSFFQNNFFMLPSLTEVVRARLQEAGTRYLVDVYCGVGFFALQLADLVERFVGIEIDVQAIRAAQQNAQNRGVTNGEFLRGSAEEQLPEFIDRFRSEQTTVILDPPRVGCAGSVIELLRRTCPQQILYVSCHPATLARDLRALCQDGLYRIDSLTPLDMFPQTQHVECITDLRLAT